MHLSLSSTTALAAAIVAAASVLAFSQLPDLPVWVAFIGWASYDHSGATPQAAVRSSTALTFGVVMAWVVAIVVAANALPLGPPVATAVCAGIASFVIVSASRLRYFAVVPATFYGFASAFAYLSLAPESSTIGALTMFGWKNVLVAVPISLLTGTGLGITHGWLAKFLATAGPTAAPGHAARYGGKS